MIKLNQRGQEFEPFRLLIAAVFALVVLMIIVGAINYFESLEWEISMQRLNKTIESAAQTPNGIVVVARGLRFREGTTINALQVAKITGVERECIEFTAYDFSAFRVSDNSKSIHFEKTISTNVFVQCGKNLTEYGVCPSTCDFCCLISFGKILHSKEE